MRRTSAFLAVIAVVTSFSAVVAPGVASATSLGGTGIGYLEAQSDGVVFATGSALRYGGVTHPNAHRTKAFCRLKVFRDADGSLVYAHNGQQSHVVLPPGTYYIRREELCPVRVS